MVAREYKLPPETLQGQGYAARLATKIALELACRHCGESQRRIGEYFGYRGNGAVSKQRQRLHELLAADAGLQRKLEKTEKVIEKKLFSIFAVCPEGPTGTNSA